MEKLYENKMRKEIKLFFMSLVLCSFFYKTTYSEEKKFNYDQLKEQLIKKKLLLNSFKKCEEYINETSVELFLNCSDKNKKNKWNEIIL